MRTARIKVAEDDGEAAHHCLTRVVNGERVIDAPPKEVLRGQLWLTAEFCGVAARTYAIMKQPYPRARARAVEDRAERCRAAAPLPSPPQADQAPETGWAGAETPRKRIVYVPPLPHSIFPCTIGGFAKWCQAASGMSAPR